ncbi:hypothetical protein KAR91_87975 [Candidatus Pacearchaeota archaeon]|nr:hypothetical protein [Candidatus Pacearchaeota archaeon]
MEKQEEIGVNDLKNMLMRLANKAFIESFDKGERKYGDRWKTTGWNGIKALSDSKWDMFLNLIDGKDNGEIEHHASDMVAWVTILSVRAVNDLRADDKRETEFFKADELMQFDSGMLNPLEADSVVKAVLAGKRVVIE